MAQQLGMLPRLPVPSPPIPCSPADPKLGEDSPKGPWLPNGRVDRPRRKKPYFLGEEVGLQLWCLRLLMDPKLPPPDQARPGSQATGQCHSSLSPHHPGPHLLLKVVPGSHKEERSLGLTPDLLATSPTFPFSQLGRNGTRVTKQEFHGAGLWALDQFCHR